MWKYVKTLQYPVNIKKKDLRMAKYLITQYGGANGELAAAWRYLNQRYTMPDDKGKAILTDIGTVLGVIKYIGIITSVLVLVIIGLKYMLGSVEAKAEYKKTMIPYVVGCFMIMGISIILALIEEVMK